MWAMKKGYPASLGSNIRDDILPSYVGIIVSKPFNKDPYKDPDGSLLNNQFNGK